MIERVPIKTNPKLFDLAASKIQNLLAVGLPWLDHAFGICEILTDIKENKKFHSANIYIGNNQYEQIMPCDELGNFSMMILRDPQTFDGKDARLLKSPFALIIWYNMDKLSLPTDERNREQIKWQILKVLEDARFPWLKLNRIYEKPDSVFTDFSYDYTNNQFLMSPYAGMRIEGEIEVRMPCQI